jgi:hypothetical protein
MSTIRFARLKFEPKLSHFTGDGDVIKRRKDALCEVIDWSTDVNALLQGTDMAGKTQKGQWYFGDVDDKGKFISARLGKQTEDTRRKPDEDIKGFRQVEDDNTIVSTFVIDLESSVMSYEFRRDIGGKAPFRILRAVFNSYHDEEEKLSMSPLVDKEEVRAELDRLEKITRVRFAGLSPPNPDSTDSSRSMHEFLQESGIEKLLFDGESDGEEDDEGINLREEPLLDGGLNLAEEGYGSATIEGEDKDGEEKQVTTDEKPIESEVEMTEEVDVDRQILVEEIREALDRLEN